VGAPLAVGGDLEGAEALVLASTSPQRRDILEQLGIPFVVVAPDYDEIGDDPVAHAAGKARSVDGGGRLVLGVDTDVFLDGNRLGKPASAADAREMLDRLSGRTHEVVSGLCLRGPEWEELHRVVTEVTFRTLAAEEVDRYVEAGEWEGRAGAYAVQGLGATLVERVDGDYFNVVGLPVALLVRLLAERRS
jgi:nucleoside triphosphate pyrophosphatase